MNGICLPILNITISGNGAGFIPEYQAVYKSFTIKPSAEVAAAQNAMVASLVAAGLWAKLDIFYLFAQELNSDGEALKNWVTPGTFNGVLENTPADFVSLEGFTGEVATSRYISTGWIPATHGINYTKDSACFGTYIRNNIQSGVVGGAQGATHDAYAYVRNASDQSAYRLNQSTSSTANSITDSRGLWLVNRVSSDTVTIHQNKTQRDSEADASSGLPEVEFYMLCLNNNGSDVIFSEFQHSLFFAGAGLSLDERNDLVDIFETYMDSNGKGVIT